MERTKKRLFITVYLKSEVILTARQVTRSSLRHRVPAAFSMTKTSYFFCRLSIFMHNFLHSLVGKNDRRVSQQIHDE